MDIEQMLPGGAMMPGGVSPAGGKIPQLDASIDYDEEKKKKVAKDFESIFIHQLMESMKATIPDEESEDVASGQVKSMYWSFMAHCCWVSLFLTRCRQVSCTKTLLASRICS